MVRELNSFFYSFIYNREQWTQTVECTLVLTALQKYSLTVNDYKN